MHKLIRITTVPISLEKLLENQLRFMNKFYQVIAVSSDSNALKRIEHQQGVTTYAVDMTRKITPFRDFVALVNMCRFLIREKPLIVHTHTPKAGVIGMLASKICGVPHRLHTVAGLPLLETTGVKRKLLDFIERITYSCATQVYPNSYGLRDIIVKNQYCNSSKLKVIANGSSNGIDTQYFDPALFRESDNLSLRSSLGIQAEDFVFVFVGRLVGDKGINELVSAFSTLTKQKINVKLLLVGNSEAELDPLKKVTLKEIHDSDNIISVGYQTDIRSYLAVSDALVFPSYREGFPNVVMQAGSMGLASIVSDINGCNEIIVDGKNGLIIPPKDSSALLKAMSLFIEDKDLFQSLKNNARGMIVERYEQHSVWQAILSEYKKLEKNV